MRYEQLLLQATQLRAGYLADVLRAAVAEGHETHLPVGVAVGQVLAAFSLSDVEKEALQREAIERLRNV